jgi:hypothetical protein
MWGIDLLCVFLWADRLYAKVIYKDMFPVCGGKCLSRKVVHNWVEKFSRGCSEVADNAPPGWPVEIATSNCAASGRVDSSWQEDNDRQCSNCTRVFPWFNITAECMIVLKFWKMCTWWVRREVKNRENMNWVGLALQNLLQYADGEDILNRIVTGDESWVHHYQPKSKHASMGLKHPSSPSTRKFKVMPSAWKVMLTMFWDSRECC